jgi:hypothetical protein
MATIRQGDRATIAGENQRLVDVAKDLYALTSQVKDASASAQLQNETEVVLGAAERMSAALANVR